MFIMKQPVSLQSRYIQQFLGKLSKFVVIDTRKCFGPPPPGETVLQNGDSAVKDVLDTESGSRDCRLTGYFIINMWKCYFLF
jgi:hypothetical protein